MPKVNVYLPDKLANEVRSAQIPVSTVCQRALRDALSGIPESENAATLGIYGRLTGRARRATERALEESERCRQPKIGTEQLLLGILRDDNFAAQILKHLGVQPDSLMIEIADRLEEGEYPPNHNGTFNELLDGPALRTLELAASASVRFAGPGVTSTSYYIGCEHILIGLLELEQDSVKSLLVDYGITLDEVLRAGNMVHESATETADQQPAPPSIEESAASQPSLRQLVEDVVHRLEALEAASTS